MRQILFREALREALSEEMRRDASVFLMGKRWPNTTVHIKSAKEC
jgi:pyruvate/2-oxoglutarate/acetoin dehydrogenase E1 component